MTRPTDLYCVMGNPVAHSKSPWIHARFAELTGQSLRYEKRHIALDSFASAVHAFRADGGLGCNITVPFKFEASAVATQTSERALLAQASNTLRFAGDAILADNANAQASYPTGLVKIMAPGTLVIKRESIEELIGRSFNLQQIHVNLVTLGGYINEDDDQFSLSWTH